MQVFEVKNDIAEILYAPDENNLFLSDFLFLEDNEATIVSQVINIATTEQDNLNIATVKFYLSVDKANRLTKYNGHTPSKNSEVGYLDASEIVGLFRPKTKEIFWGNYLRNPDLKIETDLKYLSSNNCVICDRAEQSVSIVNNITASLNKAESRTLLLDFEGKYKKVKTNLTAVFGADFSIPLDSKALDYIFDKDLNDCPIEAKAVIQNIILEIQKYVETIPQGFIPFNIFLNIIAEESKTSKNSGLLIFYNKLLQYKQKKIFADDENQFAAVNNCNGSFKLDISNTDTKYHNLILSSIISHVKKKFYVISDVSEENLTTETIKRIYENQTIRFIPIINHEDKYLNKIKSYCKNLTVFAPSSGKKSDEIFGIFTNKLAQDEFILWGESTLFIPLIVIAKSSENSEEKTENGDITLEDLDNLDFINENAQKAEEEVCEQEENPVEIENSSELENQEEITESDLDALENHAVIEETTEEVLQTVEVEEDNSVETSDSSELVCEEVQEEITLETVQEESSDTIEEVSDTTTGLESLQQKSDVQNSQSQINEIPPSIKDNARKISSDLPIYDPKEMNNDNPNEFKEGNRVIHAKYGEGTVEKIIVYGNKSLCSIQFDNIGRRLLDPKITTIHKV